MPCAKRDHLPRQAQELGEQVLDQLSRHAWIIYGLDGAQWPGSARRAARADANYR